MSWRVNYLPQARNDLLNLEGSQRLLVRKAIEKVALNPLPAAEGGYGKPLGSATTTNLTGFMKVKLRGSGLRIVYKVVRNESEMLVIIIGARADDEVYDEAHKRIKQHNL